MTHHNSAEITPRGVGHLLPCERELQVCRRTKIETETVSSKHTHFADRLHNCDVGDNKLLRTESESTGSHRDHKKKQTEGQAGNHCHFKCSLCF